MKKSIFLLLVCFIVLGCASGGLFGNKENKTPVSTADAFYKTLMWKYYDRAAAFIHSDYIKSYEQFVTLNKEDLNITSYEIREIVPADNGKNEDTKVKVILTFYRYPSVTEKSVETWDTWVKIEDRWLVKNDFSNDIFNE
ncbi:MAG: hypothetical protein GTO02_08405 [Candidatus Dadabacteria bacterium]|nr:hypothetical protein [Candidatus Dadabacteria bacterium]NIQ14408.1 hypothetical protein [Candidatus Dadabacteria bacterium]